ncbi:MAG: adenylosuccinate synthase [Oscillospiraceae bacterium]|nr:adenylosuccinate synthase [Oscillospiraceae bacterium]
MVKAIVGANWGDEGKGKITDMFAREADMVIRFQGGANAGHTIINDFGKFAMHLLPSGVFYPHVTNIIGNGVALNIPVFMSELDSLKERGVPAPRVLVSDRAQIVMPYHPMLDAYEEERLGGSAFGSTKSGIAPFYSDKYAKTGFQINELSDDSLIEARLESICAVKNCLLEHLYHKPPLDPKELRDELRRQRDLIAPYVGDAATEIFAALKAKKSILLEGQLGALKDTDFGIYPFVTSSSTLAGFGCTGAGIPPAEIKSVTAVTKAYSSTVGAGEFTTELFGDEAEKLRRLGGDSGEYGATTGRPRRVGWFDCVATEYGCRIQGADEAVLTAIDVLGYLDSIKVCVGYEIDGKITDKFPVPVKLAGAKPVYTDLPGWKCDVRGEKDYNALPAQAKRYVDFIEKHIGVPIRLVSTGPRREDVAVRKV